MAIKKLVAREFTVTEEDMVQAERNLEVGERYSYFFDEETEKFYAPVAGYTVLGDDLDGMFYEVSAKGEKGAAWIHMKDLIHFNLKEGDVLAVRVTADRMFAFLEQMEKAFESALSQLEGKVIVAVIDDNTDLTNDPAGAEMILAERKRQIRKGLDADNDDKWEDGEMAHAAAYYAECHPLDRAMVQLDGQYIFGDKYKHDRIRQLTIAGGLIAAEIDRLKRLRSKRLAEHGGTDED